MNFTPKKIVSHSFPLDIWRLYCVLKLLSQRNILFFGLILFIFCNNQYYLSIYLRRY